MNKPPIEALSYLLDLDLAGYRTTAQTEYRPHVIRSTDYVICVGRTRQSPPQDRPDHQKPPSQKACPVHGLECTEDESRSSRRHHHADTPDSSEQQPPGNDLSPGLDGRERDHRADEVDDDKAPRPPHHNQRQSHCQPLGEGGYRDDRPTSTFPSRWSQESDDVASLYVQGDVV